MGFNPLRIEKDVELGGQRRKLVFTMGMLIETERLLGRSVVGELSSLAGDENAVRLDFLQAALCAGIRAARGNRATTPERVAEMLPNDFAQLGKLYGEVLPCIAELLGASPDATEDVELVEHDAKKAAGQVAGPSAG